MRLVLVIVLLTLGISALLARRENTHPQPLVAMPPYVPGSIEHLRAWTKNPHLQAFQGTEGYWCEYYSDRCYAYDDQRDVWTSFVYAE